jgi:hypothetical protein
MQKFDRLGWAAGLSIHAYGRRIGIRTNDAAVLERISELLPPGWEPCFSPLVDHLFSLRVGGTAAQKGHREFHLLHGGLDLHARSLNLEEVLRELESRLHLYVGETASNRVFVHAGVVGWRGRAILLPGVSRAGKSTLVAALLLAGASYYSDEYAVLCPQGMVHPFPRPLSIRRADGSTQRCGPGIFGSRPGESPLPVGLVVLTTYRAGAHWRPRVLTTGQAVLALLEHTLTAQTDPEGSLAVLHKAVNSALVLKGLRAEAGDLVAPLLARLETASSCSEGGIPLCCPEPEPISSPFMNCPTKHSSTIDSATRLTV